jgi:hypothetical protein
MIMELTSGVDLDSLVSELEQSSEASLKKEDTSLAGGLTINDLRLTHSEDDAHICALKASRTKKTTTARPIPCRRN